MGGDDVPLLELNQPSTSHLENDVNEDYPEEEVSVIFNSRFLFLWHYNFTVFVAI